MPQAWPVEDALLTRVDSANVRIYDSTGDLLNIVREAAPACIVLVSHDPRFGPLRRDPRSIRWAHETRRGYDPQAARCRTMLFATSGQSLARLPGYAGVARPFRDWSFLDEVECSYTPGPLCVLGTGCLSDPWCNFKSFQALAEKFTATRFVWHGAPRVNRWQNVEFFTAETSTLTRLLSTADILLWCAVDDPFPLAAFHALYLGVRVWMFTKHLSFDFPDLRSDNLAIN